MKNCLKLKLSVLYQISTKSKWIEFIIVWLMLVDWFVNKHININHSNDIIEIMKKDHQNEINFNPSSNLSINERESKISEYQRININEHECERNQIIWEEKLKNQFISKMKSFQFIHFYFNSIYFIHFYYFLFKTSLLRKWTKQNQISSHFLNYYNQIKMKYSIPMKLFKKVSFSTKGLFLMIFIFQKLRIRFISPFYSF